MFYVALVIVAVAVAYAIADDLASSPDPYRGDPWV